MTMADQHTTGSPYTDAWQDYWNAGWRGIVPLPYMRKMWPPVAAFAAGTLGGGLGYGAAGFWALGLPCAALAVLLWRLRR